MNYFEIFEIKEEFDIDLDLLEEKYHDFVMQTATELDIPIIDIHNEVFELHSDPLSLFPFRMRNLHYNAKGYKLIAEAIGKRLEADNYVSIKSKE